MEEVNHRENLSHNPIPYGGHKVPWDRFPCNSALWDFYFDLVWHVPGNKFGHFDDLVRNYIGFVRRGSENPIQIIQLTWNLDRSWLILMPTSAKMSPPPGTGLVIPESFIPTGMISTFSDGAYESVDLDPIRNRVKRT